MNPEMVSIGDRSPSGSTAKILVGLGFNCFSFQVPTDLQPVEVLYSPPDFASGTLRPSHGGIPLLFPFAGRLAGSEIKFREATYSIGDLDDHMGTAIHGYVLHRPWQVIEAGPRRVVGQFHCGYPRQAGFAQEMAGRFPSDGGLRSDGPIAHQRHHDRKSRRQAAAGRLRHASVFSAAAGIVGPGGRMPHSRSGPAKSGRASGGEMLPPTGEHQCRWRRERRNRPRRALCRHGVGRCLRRAGVSQSTVQHEHRGSSLGADDDADVRRFFPACVVFNPPHRQAICVEPYSCIPNAYALAERGIDAGLRVLEPGESVATRITISLSSEAGSVVSGE